MIALEVPNGSLAVGIYCTIIGWVGILETSHYEAASIMVVSPA